jgi:hypothetical protein
MAHKRLTLESRKVRIRSLTDAGGTQEESGKAQKNDANDGNPTGGRL